MEIVFKETKALPMPSEPGRDMQSMVKAQSVDNAAVIETAGVSNDPVEEVETENVETSTTDEKVGNEPPKGSMQWYYKQCRVDINDEVLEPDYLLEIDGVKCFPRGDFSIIKAPQKSGKTMTIACMVAALIGGELWKLKALEKDLRILVIDTEQSTKSSNKLLHRIQKMSRRSKNDIHIHFELLNMRKLSVKERNELLSYAIEIIKPDVIIIDGIVDLCNNFNDVEESKAVVDTCMKLSSMYNCHIFAVIHTNPSDADGKGRGHLGTMAAQKAFEVIQLKKNIIGVFTVSSYCSRETPMPTWAFRFDDEGNLISADDYANTTKEKVQAQKDEQKKVEWINYVDGALKENGGNASRSEIVNFLMEKYQLGHSKVYDGIKLVEDNYQVDKNRFSFKTQTRELENEENMWAPTVTTDDSIF